MNESDGKSKIYLLSPNLEQLVSKQPSLLVKRKAIDMTKIKTVARDNLETTFQGTTRNVQVVKHAIQSSLSSLGVKVLDSEEVEKNVLQQAVTLSEQQAKEFQERKLLSFLKSSSLIICSEIVMYNSL